MDRNQYKHNLSAKKNMNNLNILFKIQNWIKKEISMIRNKIIRIKKRNLKR
jgi:hypothetical protein